MKLAYKISFIILLCLVLSSFDESKKTVKKYKIKSLTETVTSSVNEKEITYTESVTTYNKEGKETSITEYNSNKTIKKQETTVYDNEGNKIQETILKTEEPQKTKVNYKRLVYKYNANNDRTEEIQYDVANKIQKRELFGYNNLGERNSVTVYDGDGKITKKQSINYSEKGLKTEKKTYDANNKLLSIKKYTYEYY